MICVESHVWNKNRGMNQFYTCMYLLKYVAATNRQINFFLNSKLLVLPWSLDSV